LTRSAAPDPLIRLRGASLGYGGRPLLPPIDLELRRGEFLALVGPNGSGKTTVLRALLGLIRPISGTVEQVPPLERVGYVPQRKTLDTGWPLRTLDVVQMGLFDRVGLLRQPGPEHRAEALRALASVGLEEVAERRYDALSGGQKQRVLIARALAGRPSVLMLDEPTAGMDLPSTGSILSLLARLHREGLTVILVTHQLNEVANTTERVALLTKHGLRVGTNREILTAENLTALFGVPVRRIDVNGDILITAEEPLDA